MNKKLCYLDSYIRDNPLQRDPSCFFHDFKVATLSEGLASILQDPGVVFNLVDWDQIGRGQDQTSSFVHSVLGLQRTGFRKRLHFITEKGNKGVGAQANYHTRGNPTENCNKTGKY